MNDIRETLSGTDPSQWNHQQWSDYNSEHRWYSIRLALYAAAIMADLFAVIFCLMWLHASDSTWFSGSIAGLVLAACLLITGIFTTKKSRSLGPIPAYTAVINACVVITITFTVVVVQVAS